jgi:hypothetical protein
VENSAIKKTFKQKLLNEFSEYMINVLYLTFFFGAFAVARRLTLAHYDIYIEDYFIGCIKALVIAKVIMIGAFLKISRKFENKPILIPVLYKTVLFVICVILFDIIEVLIKETIKLQSISSAFQYLLDKHFSKLLLGGIIIVTMSFIPFFTLKEISRVIGPKKFRNLLLKQRENIS